MSQQIIDFDAVTDPNGTVIPTSARDVLGSGLSRLLDFSFNSMEVAEDAIERAQKRHPDRAEMLYDTFTMLRPRYDLFATLGERTIRSHMDELLGRVAADGADANVAAPTAAERCAVLRQASLVAPLKHDHFTVYCIAFMDTFGRETAEATLGGEHVRRANMDREKSRVQEIIADMDRRLADDEREVRLREIEEAA